MFNVMGENIEGNRVSAVVNFFSNVTPLFLQGITSKERKIKGLNLMQTVGT